MMGGSKRLIHLLVSVLLVRFFVFGMFLFLGFTGKSQEIIWHWGITPPPVGSVMTVCHINEMMTLQHLRPDHHSCDDEDDGPGNRGSQNFCQWLPLGPPPRRCVFVFFPSRRPWLVVIGAANSGAEG